MPVLLRRTWCIFGISRMRVAVFNLYQALESMMSVRIVGHPDYLSWSPDGKYICVMNDVILSSSVDSRGGLFSSSTQSLVTLLR